MKKAIQRTLLMGLLLFGQPFGCPEAFSGQKMAPLPSLREMQNTAMSPAEEKLLSYQREKESLLRTRHKGSAAHLVKNRIKILDGKINFLQQQLRSERPRKTTLAAPTLKLKAFSEMEPRHRIFIARIPAKVQPLSAAALEKRGEPAQGTLIPQVTPKTVELQPVASQEKRSEGMQGILPVKVVSRMKGVKTGADWKNMSRGDKEIYVLSVMGNLSRRDVYLEKSYDFYIEELDRAFQSDPELEKEYVHHLLLKSALEHEPESRKDIEKVWK